MGTTQIQAAFEAILSDFFGVEGLVQSGVQALQWQIEAADGEQVLV